MQYLTQYSGPPPRSAFKNTSLDRLNEIRAEIDGAKKSSLQTEWAQAAHACDWRGIDAAINAARLSCDGYILPVVLVAQDEDGYYFATADAADDIAVRHDPAANTIDWAWRDPSDDEICCPAMVDRAVRQEFAGNHDLIRDWEQACESGYGPDGPVGIDGWVSVRLPE